MLLLPQGVSASRWETGKSWQKNIGSSLERQGLQRKRWEIVKKNEIPTFFPPLRVKNSNPKEV